MKFNRNCLGFGKHAYYCTSMEGDVAQTDLTVRIDDNLKASGEVLFHSLGTSYTTVISALIKQAVRQGRLPFDLDEQEPLDAAETEEDYYAEIRRRVADLDAGRDVVYVNPLKASANAD